MAFEKESKQKAERLSNVLLLSAVAIAMSFLVWHILQIKPWKNYESIRIERSYSFRVDRLYRSRGWYFINDSICMTSADFQITTPPEKYLFNRLSIGDTLFKRSHSDSLILKSNGVWEFFPLATRKANER